MTEENFLETVSQQLNIQQDATEARNFFLARLFYSMAGCWALTSLYDKEDIANTISKEHFDSKTAKTLQMLMDLFPQNGFLSGNNNEFINQYVEEIYRVYENAGCFYHASKRLCPAEYSASVLNNVKFIRGKAVRNAFYVSGLGIYQAEPDAQPTAFSPQKQFGLQEIPLTDWLNMFLKGINFKMKDIPEGIEYLRTQEPFNKGYFCAIAEQSGAISLARTKSENSKHLYFLYRYCDEHFEFCQLPQWRASGGEHRRIAVAILKERGTLPAIKVQISSTLVKIHPGYLLPPSEENFLRLYSWPEVFSDKPSPFKRVMSLDIYPAFKNIVTAIGYEIEEE